MRPSFGHVGQLHESKGYSDVCIYVNALTRLAATFATGSRIAVELPALAGSCCTPQRYPL